MAEVVSGAATRPTAPQPGDGAYLAASSRGQPGDRSYWPTNGGGPGHGGQRGSGHRGGPRRGGHRGQPRGGPTISQPGPSHATEVHAAEPEAPMERPPRRPKQPRAPVPTTESRIEVPTERPPHRPKQPRALILTNESQFEAPTERPPHRQKQPGALVPTNESQFEEATAYAMLAVALPPPKYPRSKKPKGSARLDGHLNAEAASFTPGPSSKDLPTRSDAVSRSSSGSRHPGTTVRSDGEGNPAAKSKPRKGKKKKDVEVEVPSTPPSPAPARSARRAAFEQQTKLTTNAAKDRLAAAVARPTEPKKVKKKNEEELKDDHVSVLTRGLKSRPFLECPICFNGITPSQPMWSCQPPDRPPAPPVGLDPTPPDLASHYSACYTPFHLSCIHDWANRSLIEERDRARVAGRDTEEVTWRCPGCQKRRTDPVGGYRCFCGRLSSPPTLLGAPHSCGEGCSRKRSGCGHACPLPCHPGPCPPCQVALIAPCPSHHTPLTVKCAVASSNNAALTPVCDETCYRQKQCGNPNHLCQDLCHYGPCKSCDELETVRCFCGEDEKQVFCGWDRAQEKMCARVGADGETERWAGRYSCGRECEMLFDCGIHPCQEKCHSHPLHPLPCPTSPAVITTCACGSTPLSHLPHPPRRDCLAPIPTCSSSCPKSRPCGHQCPRKCHTGPCPPCHEEVVRPCRCGESMLLVPCDELRVKMEKHEDVTCERVCRALRNCGRHECGRVCCPLAYKAKSKKKKPNDDMDILLHGQDDLHECHLTCGKLLSCGLHSCPKKDHKGACGRCLRASYDELICHCGNTVIYPPVACGTTITCLFPCDRPPPLCGHPKTSHQCHEQAECPPCPFLAAKPCLCGKDPSVKNVRCSQEKVSCGQPCGNLLGCGYHKCEKSCHKPGECEGCTQTCNKPKKVCKHPCTAVCHAPAKCPENDPCQHIVTQSCSCGNVQQRTSCGASVTNSTSREQVILKCNSECAIRQRNARLADALGIQQQGKDGKVTEEWKNDELRQFAAPNLAFVKMVENTFAEFIKGTRQTMVLPHMPVSKRTFVSSLADAYHLGREMVDAEPNRSVQIRRRIDTRVPTPLLSVVVTVKEVKPTLGALGNLRAKPATSSWAQSNPGATLSSIVGDHSGPSTRAPSPAGGSNTPRSTFPAPPTPISALGPAAVIGQAASRSTTPVPPMPVMNGTGTVATGTVHQGSVAGTVGKVDEDDWDQSGDEA